ncbi:MAG TPA: chromosomal replication initiator protein DnaA [Anaerolineales bacterium]|nr:chromosomal replication initiator protein DnaA [Anaerolineales bacterium]
MQSEQLWQAVLGQIQMELPRATFDTWLRNTSLVAQEDGAYIVGAPTAYARDWLDHRMKGAIKRTITGITGSSSIDVRFVVWNPTAVEATSTESVSSLNVDSPAELATNSKLNPKYSFQNFVVGPSNRLAHAACVAASENPARAYNPVFLYGGVGLGKTHLLLAIGNACLQRGLTVTYVSSEEFTNDLINSIRTHTTAAFRERYRSVDVLLIDDIQFIAGKESTQDEFFHTFNALHSQDKQLVISSDRPPKAMVTLEERLRSRFEWGLTVDIQPPDLETRQAILRAKAERSRRQVDSAVIELIARRVQSNIRELEGALVRVLAYADLTNQPLTVDLAGTAIADLLPRRRTLTANQIISTVADYYRSSPQQLMGPDRSRETAWARQVAMYLIREESEASLPAIGDALGGRDHTTIMYGCKKVADLVERDDSARRQVLAIRERLYGQPAVPTV